VRSAVPVEGGTKFNRTGASGSGAASAPAASFLPNSPTRSARCVERPAAG